MPDILPGEVFAEQPTEARRVTPQRLNNHVAGAVILPAFIAAKPAETTMADEDQLLFYRDALGELRKITKQSLFNQLHDQLAPLLVGVPAGFTGWFPVSTPPSGWLECNGQAASRTTYAGLFAVIGTTYGSGDGATTFNVPDLRGEFVRGWDHGRGVDTGRALGSAQADAVQDHNHTVQTYNQSLDAGANPSPRSFANRNAAQFNFGAAGTGSGGTHFGDGRTSLLAGNGLGYRGAAETRPRNVSLLPIIKT